MTSNVLLEPTDAEQLESMTSLMPNNPGQTKYYCGRCEGWYLDEETLIEHINLYHEYWCMMCRLRLRSENQLRQHMMNVHAVTSRCIPCRITFNGAVDLALEHMLEKHSEIRDKHAYMNNHHQSEPAMPVLQPQQRPQPHPVSAPQPTNNSRCTNVRNSEYLCAKCQIKYSSLQQIANHMKSRHNVEIGVRTQQDGKEEIFIINNKGKVYTVQPNQNKERPNGNKEVTVNRGNTSVTIRATETSNQQSRPQLPPPPSLSISPNVTTQSHRPSSSNSITLVRAQNGQSVQSDRLTPRVASNHVNSSSISMNQNGFAPTYSSTPEVNKTKFSNNQPINITKRSRTCNFCNKILSTNYSLNRHLKALHKELLPPESINSNHVHPPSLRIDRILPQSEIEPFEPSMLLDEMPILHPANPDHSQTLTSTSDTDSIPSVHVEIETDGELEIVEEPSGPLIEIDDTEEVQQQQQDTIEAIEDSDSDMEMIVISEADIPVPKPKQFLRVLPSQRFMRKLANKSQRSTINKQDLAARLKKINSQLRLKNKIMTPR